MSGTWITETSLARARELWAAGARTADIACAVGCSGDAIVGYAHRHGWPPHPCQPPGAEWRAAQKRQPPLTAAQRKVERQRERRAARRLDVAQQAELARRPPKPAPKSPPAVAAPEPAPEPALLRSCQWTDSSGRPWVFCGRPTYRGSPYCQQHHARCYHRHASFAPAAVVVAP